MINLSGNRRAILVFEQFANMGGGYILSMAFARSCTLDEFGRFTLLLTILLLVNSVFNSVVVEPFILFRSSDSINSFDQALIDSLLVTILLVIIFGLIAKLFAEEFGLTTSILISVLIPNNLIYNFMRRYYLVRGDVPVILNAGIVYIASCLVISVLVLSGNQASSISCFVAYLMVSMLPCVYLLWVSKFSFNKMSYSLQNSVLVVHWNYYRWSVISGLVSQVFLNMHAWVTGFFLGTSSIAELKVIQQVVAPILVFGIADSNRYMNEMIEAHMGGSKILISKVRTRNEVSSFISSGLIGLAVILLIAPTFRWLFSGKYQLKTIYIYLATVSAIVFAVGNVSNVFYKAHNSPKVVMWAYILSGFVSIVLDIVLVPKYHLLGVCISMLISSIVYYIFLNFRTVEIKTK